jgi:antitoxin HicB
MSKKHIGSSLGSFLEEMKIREETELLSIKKTLSLQLRQAMKRRSVSQSRLANEMRTSRTVINRMLDPNDTGVTLATLCASYPRVCSETRDGVVNCGTVDRGGLHADFSGCRGEERCAREEQRCSLEEAL